MTFKYPYYHLFYTKLHQLNLHRFYVINRRTHRRRENLYSRVDGHLFAKMYLFSLPKLVYCLLKVIKGPLCKSLTFHFISMTISSSEKKKQQQSHVHNLLFSIVPYTNNLDGSLFELSKDPTVKSIVLLHAFLSPLQSYQKFDPKKQITCIILRKPRGLIFS